MPSPSSSLTPLGFTRDYQAYRAANLAVPFADSRLLAAVRFWSRFIDALESDSYSSFWLEDLPPLLAITSNALEDLHPDELAEIAEFVTRLDASRVPVTLTAAAVWELAARKWIYVGEAERALHCLAAAGVRRPEPSLSELRDTIDPSHIPNALIGQLGNEHEILRGWLRRLDAEWSAVRETGHTNRATCVLVERDATGRPVRGRLRSLEAHIEQLPKDRTADEVAFGHQLAATDDPQVRGAYAALAALRNAEFGMRNAESKNEELSNPHSVFRTPHSYLRARFTFANSGAEPYGGDSLAFACFAAAYGDWWARDLHRERRLVSSQVALTGALNESGAADLIHSGSLAKKVERVFFSPLSYLAVPKGNRADAEAEVERLRARYPRRRLRILAVEHATDLVTDGNITMPERVCLGEYAVRAAAKYSRSVKVQVPILVALLYALACLIHPPLWVFFDDQPARIEVSIKSVRALNKSGQTIGAFDQFTRPLAPSAYSPDRHQDEVNFYALADVNGDARAEVILCAFYEGQSGGPPQGPIFILEANRLGGLDSLYTIPLHQATGFPGDSAGTQVTVYPWYLTRLIALGDLNNPNARFAVVSAASYPGRGQVNVYDGEGAVRGTYVNQGQFHPSSCSLLDIDSDGNLELCLGGCNNALNSATLAVFDPSIIGGVSPPWDSENFIRSRMKRGSQRWYIAFPKTLIAEERSLQDHIESIVVEKDRGIGVRTQGPTGFSSVYSMSLDFTPQTVSFDDGFVDTLRSLIGQTQISVYKANILSQVNIWRDSVRVK